MFYQINIKNFSPDTVFAELKMDGIVDFQLLVS
jgi:hypothetical protein